MRRRRKQKQTFTMLFMIAVFGAALGVSVALVKSSGRAVTDMYETAPVIQTSEFADADHVPSPDNTVEKTLRQRLGLTDDDMQYLVLVNFDNRFDASGIELVPNSYVFDDELCMYHNRSCNETAGLALNELFRAGMTQGFGRFIVNSSYRDRREQTQIWEERIAKEPNYGSDPYSSPVRAMPPGASEHETGLAFDVLTEEHPFANKWFGTFDDGKWLAEHCHEYGFILRYPEDKTHITGVQYEPWHFRYVGIKAARYIHDEGICFEEFISRLNEG